VTSTGFGPQNLAAPHQGRFTVSGHVGAEGVHLQQ
jgi:hypothetical protein